MQEVSRGSVSCSAHAKRSRTLRRSAPRSTRPTGGKYLLNRGYRWLAPGGL